MVVGQVRNTSVRVVGPIDPVETLCSCTSLFPVPELPNLTVPMVNIPSDAKRKKEEAALKASLVCGTVANTIAPFTLVFEALVVRETGNLPPLITVPVAVSVMKGTLTKSVLNLKSLLVKTRLFASGLRNAVGPGASI